MSNLGKIQSQQYPRSDRGQPQWAQRSELNREQTQWLQQLQSFLDKILQHIIKDQAIRNRYLDIEAMIIWEQAFTHETFSPTKNYEDLEYLGDAILKSLFPKYLMKRFPYLHKKEYTDLNVAYMSKIMQAQLARKLGFGPFIRIKGLDKAILNLETDVFESFFGALDTISDNITPGLGLANSYNMLIYIFSDIEIDEDKGRGAAKTQVIQIFSRFGLPAPEEMADETEPFKAKFSVSLPRESINFLKTYGVNIENPTISYTEAPTKAEACSEAYIKAANFLETYGITDEWAENAKQVRDFSDQLVAPYAAGADQRLKAEGFVSMYLFLPRKTTTQKGAVVQLIGVRPDGNHEVLSYTYSTDTKGRHREAKGLVVKQYAEGKKM